MENTIENTPFGWHLIADFRGANINKCYDIKLGYTYLEELVKLLNMDKMTEPIVFKVGPDSDYPDKEGITGFIGLITSNITIHTLSNGAIFLDCFSCKEFNPKIPLEYTWKSFMEIPYNESKINFQFLERGKFNCYDG